MDEDYALFQELYIADMDCSKGSHIKLSNISSQYNRLSQNVKTCLIAYSDLVKPVNEVAKVTIKVSFRFPLLT